MRVQILKSFPFSRDGITTLRAVAGKVEDIPDALVPGLQREGFVGSPTEQKEMTQEKAPIPLSVEEQPQDLLSASQPVASEDRNDVPQRDRRRRGK